MQYLSSLLWHSIKFGVEDDAPFLPPCCAKTQGWKLSKEERDRVDAESKPVIGV
jgi:hypothetical protein